MSILPVNVPRVALLDIARLFVDTSAAAEQSVELIVRIDDEDLNLRELGAYLTMMDRVYGRMTSVGLRSYAQSREEQLRIVEFRKGSLELIVEQAIASANDKTPLIIVYLFLKYSPAIIKAIAESAKTFAEAHKTYQEGEAAKEDRRLAPARGQAEIAKIKAETNKTLEDNRMSRENRRQLREQMKQDKDLAKLDDRRLRQLITLLEDIRVKESRQLPAAERFAEEKVIAVDLKVREAEQKSE